MNSVDTEKACNKNLTLVHDKNRKETRNRRGLPQSNKGHLQSTPQLHHPAGNISVNGERLKGFSRSSRTAHSFVSIQHCIRGSS